jgi:hypothetical protein
MHRRVVFLAFLACFALTAQPSAVAVPYVGCKSDSFVEGSLAAPSGPPKEVRVSPATAQRLAYYEAAVAPGMLGPRGWYCFGYLGSAGATLEISPRPFSSGRRDPSGPLIVLTSRSAGTSGPFDVATIIARVFPAHRDFVTQLRPEGLPPNFSFPTGPYPKDKLSYKNTEVVEYETPAQSDGLGTYAGLEKNADPIRGEAMLMLPALDLAIVTVRLPVDLRDLASPILQLFDCCSYSNKGIDGACAKFQPTQHGRSAARLRRSLAAIGARAIESWDASAAIPGEPPVAIRDTVAGES